MKKIRILSLIVLFALLISVCACTSEITGTDKTTTPTTSATKATTTATTQETETPTITVGLVDEGQTKWSAELYTMQKMAEAGGVYFNVQTISKNDFVTKANAMIAAESIPDLWFTLGMYGQILEYGTKGVFMPLDDYLGDMPNVMEYADKYPDFLKVMRASSDGKVYGLPQVWDMKNTNWSVPLIRADLLAENGVETESIITIDDLFNALIVLKDATGKAPWVCRYGENWVEAMANVFGTGYGTYYNRETDKYQFGPGEANFKLMVEFLTKCYSEGLVNPDIYKLQDQTVEQMFAASEASFIIDYYLLRNYWGPGSPGGDPSKATLEVIATPQVNGVRYYSDVFNSPVIKNNITVISAKTKHLDSVIKILDWGYSDIGIEKLSWGEEDVHFKLNSEGEREFIVKQKEEWYNHIGADDKTIYDIGIFRWGWNNFVWPEDIALNKSINGDVSAKLQATIVENEMIADAAPIQIFTQEESDRKKELEASIKTFLSENVAKFITGQKPLSEYDQFVSDITALKTQELLDIYNAALDRYNAN